MHTYSLGCLNQFSRKSYPETSQSYARVTTTVCFQVFQVNSTNNQLFLLEKEMLVRQTSVLCSCQIYSVCGHRC